MKTIIYSAIAVAFITSHAFAGEVYKYTDEKGNIIYSNKKPKNTKTETLNIKKSNNIDTKSENNRAKEQFFQQQRTNEKTRLYNEAKTKRMKKIQQEATNKPKPLSVKEAKAQLEKAKVIRAGDMFPLPNGGSRYSQQYQDRVKQAEQALEAVEKGL